MSENQENHTDIEKIIEENLSDIILPIPKEAEHAGAEGKKHDEHHVRSSHSQNFQLLLDSLTSMHEPEKKLEAAILFMEASLSQAGSPHFKDFWEAKKLVSDLFKEHINPTLRVTYWSKFSELCREARRLKEIFDEESAFACEQIEIAIKAIEDELNHLAEKLSASAPLELTVQSQAISANFESISPLQKELHFLNVYAAKVTALRKELIKTEMRVRFKNKFFLRLKTLGDLIFPRRKELINQVSVLFRKDVEKFIEDTFSHELRMTALFQVREEIKALQSIAKELTLNTEVFSYTRKKLSECWDSIQSQIHERKEKDHEQKEVYKQQKDAIALEIEALKKKCEDKNSIREKLEEELEGIIFHMKKATLGKQEIQNLRDEIREVRKTIIDQFKSLEELKRENIRKQEADMQEKFHALEKMAIELIRQVETLDLDALLTAFDELVKEVSQFQTSQKLRYELEKKLRILQDHISEKKESKLLELSPDTKLAIDQLNQILKERKARRQEIRDRLENFRKRESSSSRGFAEAFETNEELAEEKERLANIEEAIIEVQEKIKKIKSKGG